MPNRCNGGLRTAACVLALAISVGAASATTEDIAPRAASAEVASKGAWNSTTTYAKDDIVTERGSAWISLKGGNVNKLPGQSAPSTATWWRLFARGFNAMG